MKRYFKNYIYFKRKALLLRGGLVFGVGLLVFAGTVWAATVDTSNDANAVRLGADRHTFYDGTNYRAFYIDNNNDVGYEKSLDGTTWSGSVNTVATGTYTSLGIWEDGTYDCQDYEGFGCKNYVPTYMVHSLEFGETGCDNWFVCLDGDDDFLPDIFIGRLPVKCIEEANIEVNEILDY